MSKVLKHSHGCACPVASVMFDSLRPFRLQPTRFLCPWAFSRQEYWSGFPCPPSGDPPNPGIEPRSLTLQADTLPSEPPGKSKSTVKYYSAIKKNEILPLVTTWMNFKGIMLSEINQMEKDKYHMISFICPISKGKPKGANKINPKQTQIQVSELWFPEEKGLEGLVKWVKEVNCTKTDGN